MFDEIKCEYPLPDAGSVINFQSKSLNCLMDKYKVTLDGRLIFHKEIWIPVPEQDRPFYGKPEWDNKDIYRLFGCLKSVPQGDEDTHYHGILNIYTTEKYYLYEYDLIFTNGNLEKVLNKSRKIKWSRKIIK